MDLMEIERQLIGYDTTSRNSNLNMVDYLSEQCKALGAEVVLHTSEGGEKANLFATLGPRDTGGLMLAGHTDVVPVDGQDWSFEPFALTEQEGRFYGRGVADMKSFIAQALVAAAGFKAKTLRTPLHLAFTYDEEVGCHGARRMMQQRQSQNLVRPKCAVVGEPTGFQVFRLHKGFHSVRVRVKGVEGHSSRPDLGANAIEQTALVIQKLGEVAADRRLHPSMQTHFDLPYTTINPGLIQGGTALNIIPNQATLHFEYRTMPDQDPLYVLQQIQGYVKEELLPAFRQQHPAGEISVESLGSVEPMRTDEGAEIEQLALRLTGNKRSGAAPYCTEGAIYNQSGVPSVICGPGDIAQAHRPDEYITREQLEKGPQILTRFIEALCV